MKFKIEIEAEVVTRDADVMEKIVPEAIKDRFRGTPVRIGRITVTKDE